MSGTPVAQSSRVLDEVEKRVVGPVQVLEHEHGGPLSSKRLEIAAPGRERLLATDARNIVLRAHERTGAP